MGQSQEEVINHFKSGLPSGVGLRDMITQIKEHYSWSSSKKTMMIILSLMTCLLGVGLYVLDLTTDVNFSWRMLNGGVKHSDEAEDFNSVWAKKGLNFSSLESFNPACYEHMKQVSQKKPYEKLENFLDEKEYERTGWIAIYHCIQPVLITMVIFLSINCKKRQMRKNCLNPDIPTILALGRLLPNPAVTHIYSFYLAVKRHDVRSHPDFRTKIASIEEKIRKHQALGKI